LNPMWAFRVRTLKAGMRSRHRDGPPILLNGAAVGRERWQRAPEKTSDGRCHVGQNATRSV